LLINYLISLYPTGSQFINLLGKKVFTFTLKNSLEVLQKSIDHTLYYQEAFNDPETFLDSNDAGLSTHKPIMQPPSSNSTLADSGRTEYTSPDQR
jgi:hypothetical protein